MALPFDESKAKEPVMKVFLIGATGYVGSALLREALENSVHIRRRFTVAH
ncbi:Hypothetical protein A7982_06114 [Minicystis rosea]|nr:Hypothetical protein A7982_06114 [Minicystis rosea]